VLSRERGRSMIRARKDPKSLPGSSHAHPLAPGSAQLRPPEDLFGQRPGSRHCATVALLLLCVVTLPTPSLSADELSDVLDGFDDDTERPSARQPEGLAPPSRCDVDGSVGLSTAYNYARSRPGPGETDYRGFSRLRCDLELGVDLKLPAEWKARVSGRGYYDTIYSLRDRNEYTDAVLDELEDEFELGEAYLQGSITDSLDLKVGRQIAVWGKSDNIRVTDVLIPLDKREPGMVDIEALRLPVGMTRLDYYFGSWNLAALFIHEIRFSKRPPFGSDFYAAAQEQPREQELATSWENTQCGAALSGIVGKWDIAFYLADVFDDRFHVVEDAASGEKERRHDKVLMGGAAASLAAGNWLLKMEAAWLDGLRYSADPHDSKTRCDILGGIEYRGIPDTVISLEAANRRVFDFEEEMGQAPDNAEEDQFQTALRVTRDCWHETLHLRYLLTLFGTDGADGGFQRFWAEYDVTDAVKVTAGVVDYQSGDMAPYNTIGDNDRVFAELRYSF
jgi:hypothetical protein